ncbi:RING-H2 finger protein ATL7-like [Rhodamnia argentea]|uniref:RING-type E3 ubiquitin transferase n=1 Tax=Rhodamnia argentea TaxID=178133 RepID=A0ABM3H854_9MYRT|nr:RING-H2 finger protein ATL7-like [Rhodamnia argentea]
MATSYTYTYYESRIMGAQRMRTASSLSTGDDHRIAFQLNFALEYIHRRGDEVRIHRALPCAWPTRVWSDELLWNDGQFLSIILSAIGVPVEYQLPIIRMMYDKAVQMTTTPASDGANLVRMEVTIYIVTHVLLEAELLPSLVEQPLLFESVLERIRVKDGDPTSECTICLDELAGGTDAMKMPCSHIYHVDCIRQWLERSRSCPLCRYTCVRPR